jgi:hypothetical protein
MKSLKTCFAAFAVAAAVCAHAQDDEKGTSSSAVGWTPIAVGLASPVQIPWGAAKWDVYGLDLNLFYSDAPKMYGLDVAGLAAVTRNDMKGLQLAGLFNYGLANVYGARVTFGLNLCPNSVYGLEVGSVGLRSELVGCDVSLLGSAQHSIYGFAAGGLAVVADKEMYGCTLAGIANIAPEVHGCQLGVLFNMTEELHGAQIALVNFTEYCENGFQIGLVNIIMSNQIKVLPFVNGRF